MFSPVAAKRVLVSTHYYAHPPTRPPSDPDTEQCSDRVSQQTSKLVPWGHHIRRERWWEISAVTGRIDSIQLIELRLLHTLKSPNCGVPHDCEKGEPGVQKQRNDYQFVLEKTTKLLLHFQLPFFQLSNPQAYSPWKVRWYSVPWSAKSCGCSRSRSVRTFAVNNNCISGTNVLMGWMKVNLVSRFLLRSLDIEVGNFSGSGHNTPNKALAFGGIGFGT